MLIKGVPLKSFYKLAVLVSQEESAVRLTLGDALVFSNYLPLKRHMDDALGKADVLVLDVKTATYMDHTVMEHLKRYIAIAQKRGKEVLIENIEVLKPVSDHPLAARSRLKW